MSRERSPVALTVAGSDSGGGAGIQADLKTFEAFGVFGTSVVTAVTAQNTVGVSMVHGVPTSVLVAQIEAVAGDLRPAAWKSGMLPSNEVIARVAESADLLPDAYVLDPVMVATSGDRLVAVDARDAIADRLVPLSAVVTPNLPEAEWLTGMTVETEESMLVAARRLVEMGAGAALVKGGHLAGDPIDVLWDGERQHVWRRERIETTSTHGTGCTLSAAIAAGLARGQPLVEAVERALRYLEKAIRAAPGLGSGHGPLRHSVDPD